MESQTPNQINEETIRCIESIDNNQLKYCILTVGGMVSLVVGAFSPEVGLAGFGLTGVGAVFSKKIRNICK